MNDVNDDAGAARPGRRKGERPSGNPPPPEAAPFYGRRHGKTLREHHAGLMQTLLPHLSVPDGPLDLAALFGRAMTGYRLEIGFGGGEHLAQRAGETPDVGFIGCEPFVNGVAKALALIEEGNLDNVRIHANDAGRLIDRLPAASLARVDILYPDPWPKRRQRKRRFVSDATLKRLARALAPGGLLCFATDIDDYAGWTLQRMLRSPDYDWPATTSADWLAPWAGWRSTRYEEKARREGRTSAYLTFVRR
ncbi:MAG: tRNA (guanosine(46)-N7)-methyltransferase TrmB [Rhizobiales bacterium]|nr:tRNA (guanosine(46)-N7)-methyltransferase TrmB [Hyphomicrobiales bacterium]